VTACFALIWVISVADLCAVRNVSCQKFGHC
jgi:hypothetical protein